MLAYSLSKMTLTDEFSEYDKYHQMNTPEFYEFLGRWAELIYIDLKIPLVEKISKLLPILLESVNIEFRPLNSGDDIESDSDYDDDIVDSILQERFGSEL